jgi:3-oxoacyl-[acyl-carrier protein] reductase
MEYYMNIIKKNIKSLLAIIGMIYSQNSFADASKLYLITAATSGIGYSVCETLASNGHELILAGRDIKKLETLKTHLEKSYKGKFEIATFDYTDIESIQNMGKTLENKKINGVVIIPPRPQIPTKDIPSPDQWSDMVKNCFAAPLEIIHQIIPSLQPEGSIVIIDGITSQQYIPAYANSNVLRLMWVGESKNLSYLAQLTSKKIRSNLVSPGAILTDFQINKIKSKALDAKRTYDEQLKLDTSDIPLERYGQPSDVANTVLFLLSNHSKHINGINLILDGGFNKSY